MIFTPSPKFADAVLNHPSVRPTVQRGIFKLSSAEQLSNPFNKAIAYDGGFALFLGLGAGIYDVHLFCISGSRGAAALQFGKLGLCWLFTDSRVVKALFHAPLQLPAVSVYCRRLGLKPEGRDLFMEFFSTEAGQWAA